MEWTIFTVLLWYFYFFNRWVSKTNNKFILYLIYQQNKRNTRNIPTYVISFDFRLITQGFGGGGLVISLIFGREVVKIEGACLLVSRVSGATHHTATDTPGACCGREDREERRGKRRRRQKR